MNGQLLQNIWQKNCANHDGSQLIYAEPNAAAIYFRMANHRGQLRHPTSDQMQKSMFDIRLHIVFSAVILFSLGQLASAAFRDRKRGSEAISSYWTTIILRQLHTRVSFHKGGDDMSTKTSREKKQFRNWSICLLYLSISSIWGPSAIHTHNAASTKNVPIKTRSVPTDRSSSSQLERLESSSSNCWVYWYTVQTHEIPMMMNRTCFCAIGGLCRGKERPELCRRRHPRLLQSLASCNIGNNLLAGFFHVRISASDCNISAVFEMSFCEDFVSQCSD